MIHRLTEFKIDSSKPDGSFEGYGSAFNTEDEYGDVIVRGAFRKTLAAHRAKRTMPKMLLNHGGMASGQADPFDLLPIGKWISMEEDEHGLVCKGRLINLDTDLGRRVYGALRAGELDGLSIGYRVTDYRRGTRSTDPKRTIVSAEIFEVSLVTFPANTSARVGAVKSEDVRALEKLAATIRNAFA